MTNDLEATGTDMVLSAQSQSLTQWRKPCLPDALNVLVESKNSFNQMPVVGPKSAAALREFVNHPSPPLATEDWIEKQIVVLSVKPQRGRSAVEAQMLIDAFVPIMAEHSRVDLGYAIGRLMRENKWFPDISEIVELAEFTKGQRESKRIQAAALVAKHEREWTPPVPEDQRVAPEEVAALVAELRIGAEKEG